MAVSQTFYRAFAPALEVLQNRGNGKICLVYCCYSAGNCIIGKQIIYLQGILCTVEKKTD